MEENYIVYVKIDNYYRIININSSAFLTDLTDWIEVDSGYGDKHHHAQGNYFPLPIYTEERIPRYKLVDGIPVERTAEEIAADITALPEPTPTKEELLQAQIDALTIALLEG